MAMYLCTCSGVRYPFEEPGNPSAEQAGENLAQLTARRPEDRPAAPFGHEHKVVLAVPFGMG